MGGGGSDRYIGPLTPASKETLQRKLEKALEEERERLDKDVNLVLQSLLSRFNSRDTESTNSRLEEIKDHLGSQVELDTILYGGSVAKHTEVDGISDVDALVILDKSDFEGKLPRDLIDAFYKILRSNLPLGGIESIDKGRMAVTITYKDQAEIQLLPALKTRNTISVASEDGESWIDTKPRFFQQKLTDANSSMNRTLIPAIKLVKSINADLPKDKQLSGYHIETLAVDAVADYQGAKTTKAILLHLLGYVAGRVLRPIRDITGQSRIVDRYLGKANSKKRVDVSQTFVGMKKRLETATTASQWRAVFEE